MVSPQLANIGIDSESHLPASPLVVALTPPSDATSVAGEHPPYLTDMYLWDAKLKLLGHAFEVINYARHFHLFAPTPTQEEAIARGQQELFDVIAAIGREGVGKYAGDKELFDLLVGDACHAYHGLTMVRG